MRMLADASFHSGTMLAHALGVSRGTVSNAVHALQKTGLEIYAVKGRGYRLAQPISVLDAAAIARHAGGEARHFRIEVRDVVDSTNTLLMQRAAAAESGVVLIAEWQQSGRGRMERPWQAVLGGSITLSLLWRFRQGAAALAGLSLAVGVALARVISAFGAAAVQLKWPNDVLWCATGFSEYFAQPTVVGQEAPVPSPDPSRTPILISRSGDGTTLVLR